VHFDQCGNILLAALYNAINKSFVVIIDTIDQHARELFGDARQVPAVKTERGTTPVVTIRTPLT